MRTPVLQLLLSNELSSRVSLASTPNSMRTLLRRSSEVRAVRDALFQGNSPESTLRKFVNHLMQSFRQGERFEHDIALAALAVVLERRQSPFADEFLRDLSRLHLAEISASIRVARECLRQRELLSVNRVKFFQVRNGSPVDRQSGCQAIPPLQKVQQTRAGAIRALFPGKA